MSERMVRVRRTVVAEYVVPVRFYVDASEADIEALEREEADVGVLLDNVVSEDVTVEFFDGEPVS